jgi:hypothetical protein
VSCSVRPSLEDVGIPIGPKSSTAAGFTKPHARAATAGQLAVARIHLAELRIPAMKLRVGANRL